MILKGFGNGPDLYLDNTCPTLRRESLARNITFEQGSRTLNTDQPLAGSYRPLGPVECQDLGVWVQINEFGVLNGGRMTSAHFDHRLLARFHFIQL